MGEKLKPTPEQAEQSCPFRSKRQQVAAARREFETYGYPHPDIAPHVHPRYHDNRQQLDIDLYALSTPVIEDVVLEAYEKRVCVPSLATDALSTPTNIPAACFKELLRFRFNRVEELLGSRLLGALGTTIRRHSQEENHQQNLLAFDNLAALYLRLNREQPLGQINDGFSFIGPGVTTATKFLPRVAAAIPTVYAQETGKVPTATKAKQVFQASYPFVLQIASQDLATVFGPVMDLLGGHARKPIADSYLQLNKHLGVELTETFHQDLWEQYSVRIGADAKGCPATHSKALITLHKWNTEIAGEIYEAILPKEK